MIITSHFMRFIKGGQYMKAIVVDFENVKYLIEDSIKRQLVSDGPICTMLSGGLDSSIITTYVANYMKQKDIGILNTFSVDYIDNDKNFIKTDFQPNSDKYYINIMAKLLRN